MEQSSSQPNLYDTKKFRLNITERMAILIVGEVFVLLASIALAFIAWEYYHSWKFPEIPHPSLRNLWWLIFPWLLISIILDSYNSNNLRHLNQSLKQPLRVTIFAVVTYSVLYFFVPKDTLPRFVIVVFGCISCIVLMLWRWLHFLFFSRRSIRYKIWVVGNQDEIHEVQQLVQADKLHYEIVGESLESEVCNEQGNPILQKNLGYIDNIILALEQAPSPKLLRCLIECRELGIPIIPFPIFYETMLKRFSVRKLHGWYLSFLPMQDAEWGGFYPIAKRMLDIFCAILGCIVCIVAFPFLAIAVKISSPGPLFFSQVRVGKNGKTFRLWKFRTMISDAEKKGSIWTEQGDQRVTRIGGILRKLHVDELPQIWNLLKGDVSVVGIRPLSTEQCHIFQEKIPFHNLRHLVKPGLTSWAVVNYKHVNNLEGAEVRLEYDLYYVKHQSLWLDMLIILRTIWTMATMNGL